MIHLKIHNFITAGKILKRSIKKYGKENFNKIQYDLDGSFIKEAIIQN